MLKDTLIALMLIIVREAFACGRILAKASELYQVSEKNQPRLQFDGIGSDGDGITSVLLNLPSGCKAVEFPGPKYPIVFEFSKFPEGLFDNSWGHQGTRRAFSVRPPVSEFSRGVFRAHAFRLETGLSGPGFLL